MNDRMHQIIEQTGALEVRQARYPRTYRQGCPTARQTACIPLVYDRTTAADLPGNAGYLCDGPTTRLVRSECQSFPYDLLSDLPHHPSEACQLYFCSTISIWSI